MKNIQYAPCTDRDRRQVIPLLQAFRRQLASLSGQATACSPEEAQALLEDWQKRGWPLFVARLDSQLLGLAVARVEAPVVWLEALYVRPAFRRQGLATGLLGQVEEIARQQGEDTVYLQVHPWNQPMLLFLQKRGYDVLNLIELRRPYKGEKINQSLTVGQTVWRRPG